MLLLLVVFLASAWGDSSFSYESSICRLGEPILRSICDPVAISSILHKDSALFADVSKAHAVLLDFNRKKGFGRAISSCQVGSTKAFIAMRVNKEGEPERVTLFNPRIVARSAETFTMYDDCLSFEDLMVCVRRAKRVSVAFTDEDGQEQIWRKCSQATSELLQHEIDHLAGVLAMDRAEDPIRGAGMAVVKRAEYLERKAFYDGLVDYAI